MRIFVAIIIFLGLMAIAYFFNGETYEASLKTNISIEEPLKNNYLIEGGKIIPLTVLDEAGMKKQEQGCNLESCHTK